MTGCGAWGGHENNLGMLRRLYVLALVFALQGCVSSGASLPAEPGSYFWLPVLGVSDARQEQLRDQLDTQLQARGYTRAAHAALALTLSTDAPAEGDGSLGLGSYAGGYVYFTPDPAPAGYVQLTAYDTQSLRPVWRVQWRADADVIPSIDLSRGGASP
jgi:hypothetical protein